MSQANRAPLRMGQKKSDGADADDDEEGDEEEEGEKLTTTPKAKSGKKKKGGKTSAKKDKKPKPVRAKSAWLFFCDANRTKVGRSIHLPYPVLSHLLDQDRKPRQVFWRVGQGVTDLGLLRPFFFASFTTALHRP
jgi:hypothetical protein